jgi:hypothetical protein
MKTEKKNSFILFMGNSGNTRGLGLFGSESKQVTGLCEYGNESFCFMKDREFVNS